jgi:transketolase
VMGSIAAEVVAAAETLAKQGIEAAVLVVAGLTPAPVSDLIEILSQFPLALTVEAHYCVGGVGSLVAEVVAEAGLPCRVVRCGVRTSPEGVTGSQRYMQHVHGLSSDRLVATALEVLKPIQASHS